MRCILFQNHEERKDIMKGLNRVTAIALMLSMLAACGAAQDQAQTAQT